MSSDLSESIWLKIVNLIYVAKYDLVSARMERQKASIMSDPELNFPLFPEVKDKYLQSARELRLKAKDALERAEKLNGEHFLKYGWAWPLCENLRGKDFRCWQEYINLYAIDVFFKGVDPE